jgi:hypothetical protein
MSLQQKILKLKLDALVAARHASFWQKAIDEHGEVKATAFYTHLGLNHLETKSGVEWEGLTLSREPKEHEKIAVKGVAQAQESSQEAIGKILLALREELITDGLSSIKKLKPQNLHELVLSPSKESYSDLRDRLIKVHRRGRLLVIDELTSGPEKAAPQFHSHALDCYLFDDGGCTCRGFKAAAEDEFDELDDLTSLTESRVANDVQARIVDATTRYSLLGLSGKELLSAVESEMAGGSVSYIDRAARGLASKVINIGRSDEAESRKDDWSKVVYSALLDQNVCDPCASFDGEESTDEEDLEPAPSPSCAGLDQCRCFHVFLSV